MVLTEFVCQQVLQLILADSLVKYSFGACHMHSKKPTNSFFLSVLLSLHLLPDLSAHLCMLESQKNTASSKQSKQSGAKCTEHIDDLRLSHSTLHGERPSPTGSALWDL